MPETTQLISPRQAISLITDFYNLQRDIEACSQMDLHNLAIALSNAESTLVHFSPPQAIVHYLRAMLTHYAASKGWQL
jgi:uncharacterized protein with WD repeat